MDPLSNFGQNTFTQIGSCQNPMKIGEKFYTTNSELPKKSLDY